MIHNYKPPVKPRKREVRKVYVVGKTRYNGYTVQGYFYTTAKSNSVILKQAKRWLESFDKSERWDLVKLDIGEPIGNEFVSGVEAVKLLAERG